MSKSSKKIPIQNAIFRLGHGEGTKGPKNQEVDNFWQIKSINFLTIKYIHIYLPTHLDFFLGVHFSGFTRVSVRLYSECLTITFITLFTNFAS
jgi:hypothetical protein